MADDGDRVPRRSARVPPSQAAEEKGAGAIVEAAIAAMFENGYHGTSVREIATRAGMSVANVYYYFPSKHDLLFRFMERSAIELLARLQTTLKETADHPAERLAAAVQVFVERHTVGQAAAFVAATELRALDRTARAAVVARRDAIESIFKTVVHEGVARGVFAVDDVDLAVRAILDMGSSVSSWYRSDGPMTGAEVADRYVDLALSMLACDQVTPASRAARHRS